MALLINFFPDIYNSIYACVEVISTTRLLHATF